MSKTIRSLFLIVFALLLLTSFAACGGQGAKETGPLQVNTVKVIPTAYQNEAYDLREIILMEDGVTYSATACYVEYIFDASTKTYTRNEAVVEVEDLCFTPTALKETAVTITAQKDKETAQKVILIPTTVRADPLDELYQSSGLIGGADNGITKTINLDPAFIQGENSATSLHVEFNTVDPHAFGNTFMDLGNEHAQKIFTDQVWDNAIVTFWIYNPMEKPIEFQLAIMDDTHEIMTDWSNADGPHRQFAQPGQWTQIFFSLRAMGTKHRLTNSETSKEYLSVKMQYEDFSLDTAYSYDFYLDNLDVVPASMYPEIDTTYTMSDETLDQGWENMIQDIGWQGALTVYNYEQMKGDDSICSLKATFPGQKGKENSFICLSPEAVAELNGNLDMTGGKLSAYFKFENMDARVSVDIINKAWQVSNQVDMTLTDAGNGWYLGQLDLEKLQVGTGRNDNIIRIRFTFHGVSEKSVVYMDTCKFVYKHINKVLESASVDLGNMSPDMGSFYCNVVYTYVTSHLKGEKSVRSLKMTAPAKERGRFTWNTDAAVLNGEIPAIPNMTKGTLGAWFYFGDQAPAVSMQFTSDNWQGSREVFFVFTEKDNNGWYYGQLHGSDISFYEEADAKSIIRWTLIIPEGYTVYVDTMSWTANVENELVAVETPKPVITDVEFAAGEDKTIELNNTDTLAKLSFDYKLSAGKKLSVALMPNWENYFGYFDLTADGCDAAGVSVEKLENGYLRATFDFAALVNVSGAPSSAISLIYIRGIYTDASGVIENITWTAGEGVQKPAEPQQPVAPSTSDKISFTAGADKIIELANTDKLATVSFDYKLTAGKKLSVALMPNWESYYGYFDLPVDENAIPGVTSKTLDNGYTRVRFDLAALTKVAGAPSKAITMLYIRGVYTDASGIIENITWKVDDGTQAPVEPEQPTEPVITEYSFVAGQDKTIELANTKELATVSFEYKFTAGENLAIALMPDWFSYYGYIDLTASDCDVDGVTTEAAADGFNRVTFNLAEITKVGGAPSRVITMLYIRGEFTSASGVIRNITWTEKGSEPSVPTDPSEPTDPTDPSEPSEPTEPAITEYNFTAGQDNVIDLGNVQELAMVSFEYKFTDGENLAVALMPDWFSYYGYIDLTAAGCDVDGVTTEAAADGFTRVTFNLARITKINGNPSAVITMLYIRGDYTSASGVIQNITWTEKGSESVEPSEPTEPTDPSEPSEPTDPTDPSEPSEPTEPEESEYSFAAGQNQTIELANTQQMETLSFDYKLTSGRNLAVALLPNWENYYGYFDLTNAGCDVEGTTTEQLDNGYIRVTFQLDALPKVNGNPTTDITMIYINGGYTDASGAITNITWTEKAPYPQVFEGGSFTSGADLTIPMDNGKPVEKLSFTYKITDGDHFNLALMPDWFAYFGYFEFNANGEVDDYAGISTRKLTDGSVAVYVDMAALTKMNGVPSKVLTLLYVRGDWTDAKGVIENICINDAVEDPDRGEAFTGGIDLVKLINATKEVKVLRFEYKVVSGEKFNIALMPNWENFFGYFEFNADGAVDSYNGITTEKLEDGYVRVTMQMDQINKVSGIPGKILEFLYLRGEWTDANGYIDNVQIDPA